MAVKCEIQLSGVICWNDSEVKKQPPDVLYE